jgi:hypothetical protein
MATEENRREYWDADNEARVALLKAIRRCADAIKAKDMSPKLDNQLAMTANNLGCAYASISGRRPRMIG